MIEDEIVDWIKNYAENLKFGLVVGISGGIDSALVSVLCAKTGIDTHVISIPIHQNINELNRANKHMHWLSDNYKNVKTHEIDLSSLFDNFKSMFKEHFFSELAFANSRSRLRMTTLYQIATSKKCLVVGTGNKIEDFGIGFFTKYGDGGVDISPIADLTKTEVREMAKRLGIIQDIILANPTDGLWDDERTDEEQIGASYEELEWAMENYKKANIDLLSIREKKVIDIFKFYNKKNEHKMKQIPFFKKEQK